MKTQKNEKISLVKSALYSIGLYFAILLMQIYSLVKNSLPPKPIFLGPVYVPLLISCLMLVLLIAVAVLHVKQTRKAETSDELADMNKYKAGYFTKYICLFLIPIVILLLNEFNLMQGDDIVDKVMRVFLINLSIVEIVHNIVFIVLEKKG